MKLLDIMTAPWAITPDRLREIRQIYMTHMRGEKIDTRALLRPGEPVAQLHDGPEYEIDATGIAIIPVHDVLTKRITFFSWLFGAASMEKIAALVSAAAQNPDVAAILLSVDSPGGTVDGTQALASAVKSVRGVKPIVALIDGLGASAAYWVASAADKVFATDETTAVGSIGVVSTHIDQSRQDEMYGEKWTEITSGKYKRIASAHQPLSEEGRAYIQQQTDDIYRIFVDSVAENRGLTVDQTLAAADGKIFLARAALSSGLIDGIMPLNETIETLRKEIKDMDLDELKTKHSVLYEAVFAAAKAEGHAEGKAAASVEAAEQGKLTGAMEGAAAERARIQGILDIAGSRSGDSVVQQRLFDGKSTAADVAMALVQADNAARQTVMANLTADGILPVPPLAPLTSAILPPAADSPEAWKAEWANDPKIRAEFRTEETYVAYRQATTDGRVKILGRKE